MAEADATRVMLRKLIVENGDNHTNEELYNNVLGVLKLNNPKGKSSSKCRKCRDCVCCIPDLCCEHCFTKWCFKIWVIFWGVLIAVGYIYYRKWWG